MRLFALIIAVTLGLCFQVSAGDVLTPSEQFSIQVRVPAYVDVSEDVSSPRGRLSWFVFSKQCLTDADRHAAMQFGRSGPGGQCRVTARGEKENLVTTEGKTHLAAVLAGTVPIANFHALSTSTAAPVISDTGCPSEFTTQYSPNNTRASATTSSSANVFTSEATYLLDASVTIQKFCLMTTATVGTGVSFAHILTGAIPINANQSVTTIYKLTIN